MSLYPSGRIGYYWSCKKGLKLDASVLKNVCMSYGFELVKIDLEHPLEEQGPFVAIVHKLLDYLLIAENGDKKAADVLEAFQIYVDNHPDIVLIDSLKDIRKVTDRYTQYMSCANHLSREGGIFIPAFVEFDSKDVAKNNMKLKSAGIDFPILCKPAVAHGVPSHQMCIIFNEEGLQDVVPPCVAQKFINHNAVLYKLFTIGNKYVMIQRPSLKNFTAGDMKTIYFNSHDVSKTHCVSALSKLDEDTPKTPFVYPEKEKTDFIVEVLCKCLGLNLLGIDFIIDNETGQYAVVDINYFPGYFEIADFFTLLCELIVDKVSHKSCIKTKVKEHFTPKVQSEAYQQTNNQPTDPKDSKLVVSAIRRCVCCSVANTCSNGIHTEPKKPKPGHQLTKSHFHSVDCLQDDSGFETSDSCDEKKEPCSRTTSPPGSWPSKPVQVQVGRKHA